MVGGPPQRKKTLYGLLLPTWAPLAHQPSSAQPFPLGNLHFHPLPVIQSAKTIWNFSKMVSDASWSLNPTEQPGRRASCCMEMGSRPEVCWSDSFFMFSIKVSCKHAHSFTPYVVSDSPTQWPHSFSGMTQSKLILRSISQICKVPFSPHALFPLSSSSLETVSPIFVQNSVCLFFCSTLGWAQSGKEKMTGILKELHCPGALPSLLGTFGEWLRGRKGFPDGSDCKESACNAGDLGSTPGLGRSPGGGHGNPLQYSCLENPHGQRSLAGYSPWGHKESDATEWLNTAKGGEVAGSYLSPWDLAVEINSCS